MRKLSLKVLRTEDDLHSLFPFWEQLLSKVPNTILYVEPAWIGLWWKHLSNERKLHVLCFFDEEKVVGIFPLMSIDTKATTELFFIGAPLSGNMDFIIDPAYREDVFRALAEYIEGKNKSIIFTLQGFPEDSINYKYLEEMLREHRIPFYVSKVKNYVVRIERKDFDTYYRKRFSKKTIKSLNRKSERLQDIAQLEFRKGEKKDMESAFALHDLRWQRKSGKSSFSKGRARDFFLEAADLQTPVFKPLLYFLTLDGVDISFVYLFHYKNHLLLKRIGHDDTFRAFNPGSIVLRDVIRECFASDQELISFGTGEDDYKKIWTDNYYNVNTISFSSGQHAARRSWILRRLIYYSRDKVRSRRKLLNAWRKLEGRIKYAARYKRVADGRKSIQKSLEALRKKVYSRSCYTVFEKQLAPPSLQNNWNSQQTGYTFRYFGMNDLSELSGVMSCRSEEIIDRLDKHFRCCLILKEKKIVHCAWISCYNIVVPEVSLKKTISPTSVFLHESFSVSDDKDHVDRLKKQMENFLYQEGFRRAYHTVCSRKIETETITEKVKYSFTGTSVLGKTKSVRIR